MNKTVKKALAIAGAIAILAALAFGFSIYRARSAASSAVDAYNAAAQEYNEKSAPYNEAAAAISQANGDLQSVLDDAQKVLDAKGEPYEPSTRSKLERAVKKADRALVEVPVQLDSLEMYDPPESLNIKDLESLRQEADTALTAAKEATARIPDVPEIPDYSRLTEAVLTSQKAYEDSVQKLSNVTAPPDDFVMERLGTIRDIEQCAAVTEKNDPNGLLGKEGGYTGCVYFLEKHVDKSLLPEQASEKDNVDAVGIGTEGGGAVEIFRTKEEAEARIQYLTFFEGSIMDPGYSSQEGTCVIRTSLHLDDEQKEELTEAVRKALLNVSSSGAVSTSSAESAGSGASSPDSSDSSDSSISALLSDRPEAPVPWKYEYRLRGDEVFQQHSRRIIETGTTAPSGQGETYYAGPSDDVQGIINSLSPGDTLYLQGGVYKRKIRLFGGVQGTQDAYITIAAVPGEEVIFDGSGMNGHDQDQDGPSVFWLYGCSYVQLSGFTVRNAHGRNAAAILLEPGTHHVVVSDLNIYNITTPSPRSEDHCANAILLMGRSGDEISNVLLFRNSIRDCETGWSEAISAAANVRDVNVVGNRLDDTGNIAICFAGGYGNAPSGVDYPRGGLVFGNIVTNCHCVYDTGFALYADGAHDIDFVGNTVKDCDGGVEAGAEEGGHGTRNILITGNLLTDCAEAAVGIGTPGGGGHVSSVTVYGNRYRHVGWLSGGASVLRFGSSDVTTYDNSYIENDSDMALPCFPIFGDLPLH